MVLILAAALVLQAAEEACPKCNAPRAEGAGFCGQCGYKFGPVAPPAPGAAGTMAGAPGPAPAPGADRAAGMIAGLDVRRAVVQVVAAHDKELTSTFYSIVYESNMRIESILGSAFAVAPGEFVTDCGLLAGAKGIVLKTTAGRSVPAQVVGTDPLIGVTLVRADLPDAQPLALRTGEPVRSGETITAIGFSSEIASTGDPVVSTGVVSGQHRGGERIHPIEDYLQSDASLPLGLAGGPWLDSRGRVVGMSTGLVLGSRVETGPKSGIGYAIPPEWLSRALAWIRAGSPPRPWTGILAVPADADRRSKAGLPGNVKLIVEHVFEGSPAAAAGIGPGDGLLKVDGLEAAALPAIQERIAGMKAGGPVTIDVARRGETLVVPIVLVPRPDRPRMSGVDALRLFADIRLQQEKDRKLVLARIDPGTELARLRLSVGDVLQSVLSKKDWDHGARDNSRWRSVDTFADLEERVATAWSEFDFAVGLRFRLKNGSKVEVYVWEMLTPTAAF
jgi:serine protease DegS